MTRRNIDITRNRTFEFSGTLRDADGAVRDLTSATLTWRMGSLDRRTEKLELTEANGITVDADPTTGKWTVAIDPGDTDDLEGGYYTHQGIAVIGTAKHTFTEGRIRLRRDIPE